MQLKAIKNEQLKNWHDFSVQYSIILGHAEGYLKPLWLILHTQTHAHRFSPYLFSALQFCEELMWPRITLWALQPGELNYCYFKFSTD